MHRFSVPNAGSDNVISAIATDGVIEGIENPNALYQIGLQWHPELLNDSNSKNIFDSFIDASYTYKNIKSKKY